MGEFPAQHFPGCIPVHIAEQQFRVVGELVPVNLRLLHAVAVGKLRVAMQVAYVEIGIRAKQVERLIRTVRDPAYLESIFHMFESGFLIQFTESRFKWVLTLLDMALRDIPGMLPVLRVSGRMGHQ